MDCAEVGPHMTWFLNTRSQPSGGDVCPVKITDGLLTYPVYPALLKLIQGRDLLIATHGFNVHQANGVNHLSEWSTMLDLRGGVFLGALWPGDSTWLGALEYPFATKAATNAGNSLAAFINANFAGALSVSFASHSLGARVVLQAIRGLAKSFTVRRLILMAAAIDDDCLTKEYSDVDQRIDEVVILASDCDEVLKVAFPLGNPLSGIFSKGHPFWHPALGRNGPPAYPSPNNIRSAWHLPDAWHVDHGDYLPPQAPYPAGYQPLPYALPQVIPSADAPAPAVGTPSAYHFGNDWKYWQSSWTAALTSTKFR
jgi:hypothetical protein